jgi:formylglycine-generating enzyme required for sulfatase activity
MATPRHRLPRLTIIIVSLVLLALVVVAFVPMEPGNSELKAYTEAIPGTAVTFKMLPIRGGTFTMGSPASEKHRKREEGPQFEVEVEPFYLSRHEVTWGEFEAFSENYMRACLRTVD